MVTTLQDKLAVFDENKLMILKILLECKNNDICGCDLIERLELPKNLLSYHMKILTQLGYVQESRCGRKKNYSIKEDRKEQVKAILKVTELI
jgi:ArsR family transcriptional regulator